MIEPEHRRLVVREASTTTAGPRWSSNNQTAPSWRGPGPGETVGVDYVEDTPEHAHAAAMFGLKPKSGHAECSPRCSEFEMRTHTMLVAPAGTGVVCAA
jgi:hypothetical protein